MEVGLATERDGQIDLSEQVCLCSWDYPVEGGARQAELRSGDAHGVKGVDVEDVEAAASFHQHLGEALLADDGVDDEQVASRSRNVGGMVPLIEGDRRFQPAEEGRDGRLSGACLPIVYLVLALGPDDVKSTES